MINYKLDDKPAPLAFALYGLQWLAICVPTILILGRVLSQLHFEDAPSQIFYTQKLFMLAGVFLIFQVLWGHKMPILIGPASVLLIGIVSSLSFSYSVIYTSVAIGGVFLFLLAVSGLLTKISFLFTPRIIVVILLLIALTLAPVIINLLFENSAGIENFHFWFAICLVLLMLIMNKWFSGVWKSVVVLLGLVVGTIIYTQFGKSIQPAAIISFSEIITSDKTSFFIFPFQLDAGVIIAFMFCYLALLINELGSLQSMGSILEVEDMDKRTKRGVAVTGLSNIFAGITGVIGLVDFSFSPGIISATRCASRFVLIPAGIGLAVISLFPQVVSFLNQIPSLVIGAIMFYLMVSQLASGFQLMEKQKAIFNFETAIIISFPLMLAVIISFLPASIVSSMPTIVRPIFSNGFVMGVIMVILCEHFIFKKKESKES
ncbi:MAG: solute carrier family 23 protein [Dysgonamonadaceae bacterium]|nr:solute carrier family 23 protein [Dysgonamonadaceae bacterium]MDD4728035.1 solute carrier family 23 protein [Dysgonamonadaceae bacterium]